MMAAYLGILAIGVAAIIVILLKENKPVKPSPVDLLNSLEIDENTDLHKTPAPKPSSSFLHRLNLHEEKAKQVERIDNFTQIKKSAEPVLPKENLKPDLTQKITELEKKIRPIEPESVKPIVPETPKPVVPETPKPIIPETPKPVVPKPAQEAPVSTTITANPSIKPAEKPLEKPKETI